MTYQGIFGDTVFKTTCPTPDHEDNRYVRFKSNFKNPSAL